MILVDQKQVSLSELSSVLGITVPVDKILKKPLFETNPKNIVKDPANGEGAVKHRGSMDFPASFRTKLKGDKEVEIRYATSDQPDAKTEGRTRKYGPKMITFEGKAEFIANEEDKAVYFWLHFYNEQSPFKKKGIPYEYSFVDDQAKADAMIKDINLKSEALQHANTLVGDAMLITAKGMDMPGVDTMEPEMVKAQLMQYAITNPTEYLAKARSQVNTIRGLIIDSVDKGIFALENVYNVKTWKWGMGINAGDQICQYPSTVQDDNQTLITHISQHINDFLPVLIDTAKTTSAAQKLEAVAKDIDVIDLLGLTPQVVEGPVVEAPAPFDYEQPLPTTYAEAQAYLGAAIGKKSPPLAKALNDGVADGTVTIANVRFFVEELDKR